MRMRSIVDVSIRSGILPALALAVACQASGGGSQNDTGSGASNAGGTLNLGSGGTSLVIGNTGNTPENTFAGEIRADVADGKLHVSGSPADVKLDLYAADGSHVTEGIIWSVDDTKIGSISADGTFHANGYVGGQVGITAEVGGTSRTVYLEVYVNITNSDAGVTDADKTALAAGGAADAKHKFLYPYDGTVFPRGLAAPVLQLGGAAATATLTTIMVDPFFTYTQYSGAATPVQIKIPEPVWKGMTLTADGDDLAVVNVTKVSGGQVSGPAAQSYRIAQASMKGIIYYNTYASPLTMGTTDTDKGGILRIKAGGNAEVVTRGCNVCHAVSSGGTVLASGSGYTLEEYAPVDSHTYDLSATGEITPRATNPDGLLFPFAGLTPDGSKALSNGLPPGAWPTKIMRGVYSAAGYKSQLVDTATGAPITATGLTINYVQTPAFSPDGKKVAFLNGDMLDNRVLQTLDFDAATNTFSNPFILLQDPNEAMAWPTFLPDNSAVIYHTGDSFDSYEFTGGTTQSKPQYAEVHLVDATTKEVKKLEALNGRDAAGTLTLPYGELVEGRMNYEPNVLPVAVGGYYWVLFTSRRTYGNTIAPGGMLVHPQDPWGSDAEPSLRKKLWIAAIDVDHGVPDPSHPAFYLPGQELEGGNMRAFAAMAPCQPDGGACESGSDCCGGFCRQTSAGENGAPVLECVPPPVNECSLTDEVCLVAENCCDPMELCINGRCTLRSPPK